MVLGAQMPPRGAALGTLSAALPAVLAGEEGPLHGQPLPLLSPNARREMSSEGSRWKISLQGPRGLGFVQGPQGRQGTLSPSTMANIWVAFFSFCWDSFLLITALSKFLVLPLGREWISKTLAVWWDSLAWPFFSTFPGLLRGACRVELLPRLEATGTINWWLLGAVGLRAAFSGGLVLDTISISISSM